MSGDHWSPPVYGSCECDGHIEDVLELRLQLDPVEAATPGQSSVGAPSPGGDGGSPADMAVWALLTSGALATIPLADDQREWTNGISILRRGPFHWKVLTGLRLQPFIVGGEMRELERALEVQPGIDSAMWCHRNQAMVLGAPTLCTNGVQCAIVLALRALGVRRPSETAMGAPA